jgi:serine/alanine adding enzyme
MASTLRTSSTDRFEILRLEPQMDASWDAFVNSHHRGALYHRAAWRDLIANLFRHDTHYLYARAGNGDIVGVLPLVRLRSHLFGDYLVSMPYFNYGGAIAISSEIEDALMLRASDLANDLGCGHVEFRDQVSRANRWAVRTDKVSMELALPSSTEELWSKLASDVRRKIKRARREGIETVRGSIELVPEFYKVFARNMRDLGTPVYPREFFELILETFPQAASIILLRLNQEPVAAMFMVGFKTRLEMPWVSSVREFNRLMVNMLLYWEALELAIEQGYTFFDFGRSTLDSGTYRFKKQWGATEVPLYWHYWLPDGTQLPQLTPHNPKYRLAIKIWQNLPLSFANWLGPRIIKNLP